MGKCQALDVITGSNGVVSYLNIRCRSEITLFFFPSIIRTTNETLFLIHHLVFSTDPALNLRYQLQRATNRVFNNIIHVFIVTLGRLSYADPPEWVDSQGRYELETLSGTLLYSS